MSALVMILTVTMAIPGDGPEKAPGTVEQRLDLSGEWEGTWRDSLGYLWKAKVQDGKLECERENLVARGTLKSSDVKKDGIYKWEDDQLFICFATGQKRRPTTFRGGEGQELFILRRLKPRK